MTQKSSLLKPISLRRSPRLLLSKESPRTPKPRSCKPNFLSPLTTPSKVTKGPANSGNISDYRSTNCVKSANGSRKTARLRGNVEGNEGLRRSPRFRNKVNPSSDAYLSFNRMFDKSVDCKAKNKRKSNKELLLLGNDRLNLLECVDFPLTPAGIGEKKSMGIMGDSCGGISVNLERRITRSCSRLMGRKIAEDKENGSSSFKHCSDESRKRAILRSVQPSSVVRLCSETDLGRQISCCKGKENRSDSCKALTSGSKMISSDTLSHCVTRGGQRRRQNNVTGYHEKDDKLNDSYEHMVGSLDGRIALSSSRKAGGEYGLQSRNMERRKSPRLAEAVKEKKDKQEIHTKKLEGKKKVASHIDVKETESHHIVKLDIDKLGKESSDALPLRHTSGREEMKKQDFTGDNKVAGIKRKRKLVDLQRTDQGWTKEQEAALHRAYFTAKPSPHFWKKVAKVVPGKSAQECFDKVHSDNQTPIYTKVSSRAKKQNSPSLVSGSELFKSPEAKSKKTCKPKSQMARKTVRHLLQKYCHVNQSNEADLFSVLEPSVNPLAPGAFQLTPKHLLQSPESSSKSCERSSSGHKKCLSRFSNRSESPFTSPPVLKKVKNMALHEKYIDQLHVRDRKRKVAFSRCMKSAQNQKDEDRSDVHMKDVIKAAKDALVSDAKDVIDKFRHSQANIMDAFSDSEESLGCDDDEDETVL